VFKTIRDYYPFWALTYQSFVFLSRSSLSLGFPPIPRLLLPLPAILQGVILGMLTLQAKFYAFSSPEFKPHRVWHTEAAETWWHWITHPFTTNTAGHRVETIGMGGSDRAITIVFLLICLEGLMGGAAYCMTFYHVGREGDEEPDNAKRRVQKAFRMGACGSADSFGEYRVCHHVETCRKLIPKHDCRRARRESDLDASGGLALQRSSETWELYMQIPVDRSMSSL
jgi:battenin